jgi:hypothetical protein
LDGRKQTKPKPGIDEALAALERRLESLKSLFEQYFAGVQKRPPTREHEEFRKGIDAIPAHELKVTANKFKLQALKSRHLQLNNLWTKILSEIEAGTYRRDRFLLKAKSDHPAANTSPATRPQVTAAEHPFEQTYREFLKLAQSQNQKAPSRDKFFKALDQQLDKIKEASPQAQVQVKIHTDPSGRIGLKIKKQ